MPDTCEDKPYLAESCICLTRGQHTEGESLVSLRSGIIGAYGDGSKRDTDMMHSFYSSLMESFVAVMNEISF